jgi:hypothetical protein
VRALCPACGHHHEVVQVLDDVPGDTPKDVYQVAPLEACERTWLSSKDLLEAVARFGQDPIIQDDEPDV